LGSHEKSESHGLQQIEEKTFDELIERYMTDEKNYPKTHIFKKEKDIYTLEEAEQILTCLEEEPLMYRAFFNLAVYSGFRRGEMLGLEWKDVDWEHCVISVRRTSCYTPKRGMYTDTTKTPKSQRSLKFPAFVMDLLRQLKEQQEKDKAEIGSKWVETDRLFIKWNGEALFVSQPYGWFQRFCKRHGIRFCDIHSLRHFYASALINEGVDAATVSSALGHSTITTTTSIYCHVFDQAQARAGDAISSALDFKHKKTKNEQQMQAAG
jgi:integrase